MKNTQIKSDARQFKNVYIMIFVLLVGSIINIYIKLSANFDAQIDKHMLDTTYNKKSKHQKLNDILEFVRIQNINQSQVININSMKYKNTGVNANKYKNDNIYEKQKNKRLSNSGQTGKQIRKQNLSVEQLNRLVQERVQMGQPHSKPRKIRALIVKNKQITNNCGFINAINIMTPITVESATKLLNNYNVGHVVFLVDSLDQFAMEAFQTNFQEYNIMSTDLEFDVDYHFINNLINICKCQKIIYFGHNIKILDDPNGNKQILSSSRSLQVQYSSNALQNSNQISLQDLGKLDLRKIQAQQLNKYLFIFDSRYFKFVTPLNFAYFTKYTLEEIIVLPVLALAQRVDRIKPFNSVMHEFNETLVHFKNFQLQQPQQFPSSYCLVSYPSDPKQQSFEETITYLKSIFELNLTNLSVSVIVFLPYHSSISQYDYIIKLSELIYNRPEVSRFRIRFQQNKAVSSLSIYQSSHTFCPTKSMIISSRHNIIFETQSLQIISKHVQPQNQYIIASFSNEGNIIKSLNTNILEWRNDAARNIQIYNQYLQQFQIFSTDLAKNYHLWLLKSEELEFYESQAAFAIPFLQMAKSIGVVNQSICAVSERKTSQTQQKELKNIQKLPRADKKTKRHETNYNSLQNQAFQQFQQNRIPKIIHIMSEFAATAEQNLKKMNPQFQVLRWGKENINQIEFPLSYSLYVRLMQYSKSVQQPKIQVFANKLIAFEALYNHGGIFLNHKVIVNRQLSAFLKYDLFFDSYVPADQPYIGHNIMGFSKHNYFLKILITEVLILKNIELTSRWEMNIGNMLAKVMNQYELFTKAGFGGNLFYNMTLDNRECPLSQQNQPCHDYPEAYAYFYDTSQSS